MAVSYTHLDVYKRQDEALAKQKYTDYSKDGDKISFYYVIDNNPINFVEIVFDYRLAIKYRIKVNK